jgi:hypothetical protein
MQTYSFVKLLSSEEQAVCRNMKFSDPIPRNSFKFSCPADSKEGPIGFHAGAIASTVGLGGKRDISIELSLTNLKWHKLAFGDNRGDIGTLTDFVDRHAPLYADFDGEVRKRLFPVGKGFGVEYGFCDVVMGFLYSQYTATVEKLSLGAKGKVDFGLSILDNTVGLTGKDASGHEYSGAGDTGEIVAMRFVAVHLRRLVGSEKIKRLDTFTVKSRGEQSLKAAYQNTAATMKRMAKKLGFKGFVSAFIYRKSDRSVEKDVDEDAASIAGMRCRPPETTVDNQGRSLGADLSCIATTDEEPTELNDEDKLSLDQEKNPIVKFSTPNNDKPNYKESQKFPGSWNVRISGPEEQILELMDKVRNGPQVVNGMVISKVALARNVDISCFVPVYFNKDVFGDGYGTVPSYVLCYNTGIPDHHCLRPVDHGGELNNDVVTMYSKDWRVRESIIRVRSSDSSFQAKLEKIGFCVLQDEYDDELPIAPADLGPFVVMGRDELTPYHLLGTTLPEIEYCQGYVQEKKGFNLLEAAPAKAHSPSKKDGGPAPTGESWSTRSD